MPERTLKDVRVLIVENIPDQLEGLKRDLETIDEERRVTWGINCFESSLAASVEEAEDHLAGASCFDILILDLGLPKRKGDLDGPPSHGQQFLRSISKEKVKEVIIVSVFNEYENVIEAVRGGAVDFIAKPFNTAVLQARVMESWKRVLERDSAGLLQERNEDLVRYHERGLAYRYTTCFGDFADDVLQKTRRLEEHAYKRYGLNRESDPSDILMQGLADLKTAVDSAKEMWMDLQVSSVHSEKEVHRTEAVAAMLRELEQDLLPCLIVKRAYLDIVAPAETRILTFQDDVRAIVKELIAGMLAELPDYDPPRNEADSGLENQIKIEVRETNGQAEVKVTGNWSRISNQDAARINKGSFTTSEKLFSRTWGLAIMQHIAILGGGRLTVEARDPGHSITFLIPLGRDA